MTSAWRSARANAELQRAEQFFREASGACACGRRRPRAARTHARASSADTKRLPLNYEERSTAKPDRRRLYLAELFLGREEEALGRRDEARRHYERAAELYPNAQSPRLALSRLARQTGDRASAQRALQTLASVSDVDRADPWWLFYEPHKDDAGCPDGAHAADRTDGR